MDIRIREATFEDLNFLYKIELECFGDESFSREQVKQCLLLPNFVTLVALLDGELVGFITGFVSNCAGKLSGHVYTLDVKRNQRGKGVGSKLLSKFEEKMLEKGVNAVYLEVRIDNVSAKKLYFKHGYKPFKMLKDYYGQGVNGLRLKKTLVLHP